MLIEFSRGITLHPGSFTAVIAPEKKILAALNSNADLQRFLFLFVCGNYSRILSGISRTSGNFEVRRPFTADQLLTVIHEAGHTIVFVEHDPTLFDGAERLMDPIASALKQAGREAMVILWAPASDRSFAALIRQADRIIEIIPEGPPPDRFGFANQRSCRKGGAPGPEDPGGVTMGRCFTSVRQGVKGPLERWARAARALRKEDQPYGESVAALARLHSSEAFYGCDDPLEAAIFSGIIGILKQESERGERGELEEREEQKIPACTVDRNMKPDPNKKRENEERHVDP